MIASFDVGPQIAKAGFDKRDAMRVCSPVSATPSSASSSPASPSSFSLAALSTLSPSAASFSYLPSSPSSAAYSSSSSPSHSPSASSHPHHHYQQAPPTDLRLDNRPPIIADYLEISLHAHYRQEIFLVEYQAICLLGFKNIVKFPSQIFFCYFC